MERYFVAGNHRWTYPCSHWTERVIKLKTRRSIKELEFVKIQDIQQSRDGKAFWIATEDQGIFMLTMKGDQYALNKIGAAQGIGNENAQSVFEDSEGQLWISTQRNGVFKLSQPGWKGKF